MVARVARFEGVNVERTRGMIDEVEAIIGPMVEALPGYRGNLDMVAADGTQLSITLFDTDENADAAERVFDEEMPRALGETFDSWEGRRVAVERYEVLVDMRG